MADATDTNLTPSADAVIQTAYYRALELAQFRGGFLARTAHELRSPINRVISLNQMILEDLCDSPAEERQFIADAQAASLKMLEYLDFLIRISKFETGRIKPDIQSTSLGPIFEQVKDMTYLQAADRNRKLIVEAPPEATSVLADPVWLRNALTTLIEIAVDNGDRGTIRLMLAPESRPDHWHIWLDDDSAVKYWQEPTSLPPTADFDVDDTLSTSLRFSLVEATLTALNGRLTIIDAEAGVNAVRLQCSIPRSQSKR